MAIDNPYRRYVRSWVDNNMAHRIRIDPRVRHLLREAKLPPFAANRMFVDAKGFIRIRGGSADELREPFMQTILTTTRAEDMVNAEHYLGQAYRDIVRGLIDERLREFADANEVNSANAYNAINNQEFIQLISRAPLFAQIVFRSGILRTTPAMKLLVQPDAAVANKALQYLRKDARELNKSALRNVVTWLTRAPALSISSFRIDEILVETSKVVEKSEVDYLRRLQPHNYAFIHRVVAIEPKLAGRAIKAPDQARKEIDRFLIDAEKVKYLDREHLLEHRVLLELRDYVRSDSFGLNEASSFATVVDQAKKWHSANRARKQKIEKEAAAKRPPVIYPHFDLNQPLRFIFGGNPFEIHPLLTRDELLKDGSEMKHCVGDLYDGDAREGDSLLFSITSRGSTELRATLETDSRGVLLSLLHSNNRVPNDDFRAAVEAAIRPLRMAIVLPVQPITLGPAVEQSEGISINLI